MGDDCNDPMGSMLYQYNWPILPIEKFRFAITEQRPVITDITAVLTFFQRFSAIPNDPSRLVSTI